MKKLSDLVKKIYMHYKQMILYVFFGVCTTVINTVVYVMLYEYLNIPNAISTIIAWVIAVIFAFVTNKIFVFESKSINIGELIKEVATFFACRIVTGVLDVVIMVVAVDILEWNSIMWKLMSNVIVIIINYVASKFLIFKDKNKSRVA